MTESPKSFFEAHAQEFMDGRYDEAAQRYTYPCAIYHGDRVMLIPDVEIGTQQIRLHFERLKEAGVARILPRLTATSLSRGVHFTAFVEWHQFRADESSIGITFQRFFLERTKKNYSIMMLETLQSCLPDLADMLQWNKQTQKLARQLV